jgi:transcription termination/antitermination protein NusG
MVQPMELHWYVVHTYSGYEHKVKAALEERIRSMAKSDKFGEILVPSEKVVELVKGKKKTSSRKFFPGYILVNMRLDKETWHIIKSTPKVTGFVGGAMDPESVPPISEAEVREITHQMEEGAVKPKPKVLFEQGENVKVIDGPFQDFNGVVEEVKPDKGKLRVLISIFGRATPVELDFVQVEKA